MSKLDDLEKNISLGISKVFSAENFQYFGKKFFILVNKLLVRFLQFAKMTPKSYNSVTTWDDPILMRTNLSK